MTTIPTCCTCGKEFEGIDYGPHDFYIKVGELSLHYVCDEIEGRCDLDVHICYTCIIAALRDRVERSEKFLLSDQVPTLTAIQHRM